jgi:hypothetical protein
MSQRSEDWWRRAFNIGAVVVMGSVQSCKNRDKLINYTVRVMVRCNLFLVCHNNLADHDIWDIYFGAIRTGVFLFTSVSSPS